MPEDDETVDDSQDDDDITTNTRLRSYAEALAEEGIDADEIMMDIVVQESLDLARSAQVGDTSGAGSSKPKPARTPAAALRAAAAERRLSHTQSGVSEAIDVDAYESDPLDMLSDLSSEDEPLKGKGKAKAKGKGKAKAKAKGSTKTISNKKISWAERKREQKRLDTERKAEEKALRKKLGRKLTQVYLMLVKDIFVPNIFI